MKELKEEFTGRGDVGGFLFKQLAKSDKAYMYEVNDEGRIQYEVFERRENTRFNCVSYPGTQAFGNWAWCYDSKDRALSKFNQIK